MSAVSLPFPPPNSHITTGDEISRAAQEGNVIAQLEMIRRAGALNLLDRRAAEQVASAYGYVELATVLAAYGTAGYLALLEILADWRTTDSLDAPIGTALGVVNGSKTTIAASLP